MANDIYFGSSEIDDVKLGSSQVDKVYIGDTLVWPISTAGAVTSSALDDAGRAAGDYSGTYTNVPQSSSDGSGTGAEFDLTITYLSNKNLSYVSSQSISLGNQGSGYAVGEVITLDMSGVGGTWSPAIDIEVLTVTS